MCVYDCHLRLLRKETPSRGEHHGGCAGPRKPSRREQQGHWERQLQRPAAGREERNSQEEPLPFATSLLPGDSSPNPTQQLEARRSPKGPQRQAEMSGRARGAFSLAKPPTSVPQLPHL